MRYLSLFGLAVLVALCSTGCRAPEQMNVVDASSLGYQTRHQRLAAWTEATGRSYRLPVTVHSSTDGLHTALLVKKDNKYQVVWDGKAGPEYDEVGSLEFSENGQHLAYTVREGKQWKVVHDGRVGPAFDEIDNATFVRSPEERAKRVYGDSPYYYAHWYSFGLFNKEGDRLIYCVIQGNKRCVVVDGTPSAGFEGNLTTEPTWSPDEEHFAWVVHQATYYSSPTSAYYGQNEKYVVMLDGQAVGIYDRVVGAAFGSNGSLEYIGATKEGDITHARFIPARAGAKGAVTPQRGASRPAVLEKQ